MKIEKVLVVDDSKVAHLTLRKMLTERGIEVDWVGSGEESIKYLKERKPNLVFMDVMMPGMDGFETTTAINTDASINPPPIVMCSANTTNEDKENARRLGAVDFLSKPYTSDELDTVLNKVRALSEAAAVGQSAANEPTAAIEFAAPAAERLTVPVAGADDAFVLRAEQAAWAAADKVSREVAAEVARAAVETAARDAAEGAARKAAQAATQAAKSATEKALAAAVADVTRSVTEQVKASVTEQVAHRLADQKAALPDVAKLRHELSQELERKVAQQVEQAVNKSLAEALAAEAFKKQLADVVKQRALPAVEEAARKAAVQASQETVGALFEARPSSSKLAIAGLVTGLLALAGVAGLLVLNVL